MRVLLWDRSISSGYGIDTANEALLVALRTVRHPLRTSMRRLATRIRSVYREPPPASPMPSQPDSQATTPRPPLTTAAGHLPHP